MPQPLEGIRVLDLTRLLPGAVCTMILVDLGADVIKIEDPTTGDYARWMPPFVEGLGVFFRSSNRGKRSIIIDLKESSGQAVLHKLAQTADVLVEGFRPGVTERLGCDYANLKAINPRLVYCSLSGWGQDGPYADLSGHDLNYVSMTGVQGAAAVPQPLGAQVADIGGAYAGVMGILAALLKRNLTNEGDHLDIALAEAGMLFSIYPWVEAMSSGTRGGEGGLTGGAAFYNIYKTKDERYVALGAIEPKFWSNFCYKVDHTEWIEEYTSPTRQAELKQALTALFATKTASDWDSLLGDADCCFSVVLPPDEIADDPHVWARGTVGVDDLGVPWMRTPIRMMDDHFSVGAAPGYGEHTEAVLRDAGFSAAEIDSLAVSGVIKQLVK